MARHVVDTPLSPELLEAMRRVDSLLKAEIPHGDYAFKMLVRGQIVWARNQDGDVPPRSPLEPTEYF
jgi:predicted Rdx family selenoprotein